MEFLQNIDLGQIGVWVVAIVGAASLLSQALTKVAKITPNTKDDAYAGKLAKLVSWGQVIIDRLALNPKQSEARK